MNRRAIDFAHSARKELELLDDKLQDRILAAIEKLSENPWPLGCKKLKGEDNTYRVRVGSYRIVYEVFTKNVLISRIRHRRDVYR